MMGMVTVMMVDNRLINKFDDVTGQVKCPYFAGVQEFQKLLFKKQISVEKYLRRRNFSDRVRGNCKIVDVFSLRHNAEDIDLISADLLNNEFLRCSTAGNINYRVQRHKSQKTENI